MVAACVLAVPTVEAAELRSLCNVAAALAADALAIAATQLCAIRPAVAVVADALAEGVAVTIAVAVSICAAGKFAPVARVTFVALAFDTIGTR
jgi:hypothetical protein